jgi:hypothetical protein
MSYPNTAGYAAENTLRAADKDAKAASELGTKARKRLVDAHYRQHMNKK